MHRANLFYLIITILIWPFFNESNGQITNPRPWAEWEETDGVIVHQPNFYIENPSPIDLQIAEEWDRLYVDLIEGLVQEGVNIYYILDTNNRPEYHSGILDTMQLKYGIDIHDPKFHVVIGCRANYNRLTKWTRDHGPMNVYKNKVDSLYLYLFKDDNRGSGSIIRNYLNLRDTVFNENASSSLASDGGNYMVDGNKMGIIDFGYNAMLPEYQTKFGLDTVHQISHYLFHCDYYMKLVNEETIILTDRHPENYTYGSEPYSYEEDSVLLLNILSYLQEQVISQYGRPLKVYRICSPPSQKNDSLKLWYHTQYASYTNSIIVNNSVFVPQFDVLSYDSIALEMYKKAMPGYNIIPVYSRRGLVEGGAVHCLTNSVAAIDPIWIYHAWYNDTLQPETEYEIKTNVMTRSGVFELYTYYSKSPDGPFNRVPMQLNSGNEYRAFIPRDDNTDIIHYYIEVTSNSGKTITKPFVAPYSTYQLNIDEESNGLINKSYKASGHIKIFPNPAVDITHIEILSEKFGKSNTIIIKVFDLYGKIVKKQYTSFNEIIELNLKGLAAGQYFIIIQNEGGFFLSNKLIIR